MLYNKKIIIFDLDGTLLDSASDLHITLNILLKEYEIPEVSYDFVRNSVGEGALVLIEKSLKFHNLNLNIKKSLLKKRFLEIYDQNCTYKTSLYKGCKSLLKKLDKANKILVLVSNKPEYFVKKISKHFEIYNFFSVVSGGDTFKFKKPDPRHLISTLEKIDLSLKDSIMIGDSITDFNCAKNAGIPIMLASYGYSNFNIRKLEADYIFDSLTELVAISK